MNRNLIWQLLVFVAILLALNALFALHISILGSLLLTIVLSFVFSYFRQR